MGKIRVKTIGIEEEEKKQAAEAKKRAEAKKVEKKAETSAEETTSAAQKEDKKPMKKKMAASSKKSHGEKYQAVASLVDKNKVLPDAFDAKAPTAATTTNTAPIAIYTSLLSSIIFTETFDSDNF